jgi:hypothetical protein
MSPIVVLKKPLFDVFWIREEDKNSRLISKVLPGA